MKRIFQQAKGTNINDLGEGAEEIAKKKFQGPSPEKKILMTYFYCYTGPRFACKMSIVYFLMNRP